MQKVLVTGGSKGIGFEITKKFLENNFEVFVVARNFDDFSFESPNIHKIPFDLANVTDVSSLLEKTGEIDVLINNAGILNALPFDEYPDKMRDEMIKINLLSPVELIKTYSKGMISKKSGRIVNISSISGEIGHKDVWYGVTKAGEINFTKSFAKILGIYGILVNCVAPGPIAETGMFEKITPERKEEVQSFSINNEFAEKSDVAEVVFWLGSSSPKHINGICVDVNNGAFMR